MKNMRTRNRKYLKKRICRYSWFFCDAKSYTHDYRHMTIWSKQITHNMNIGQVANLSLRSENLNNTNDQHYDKLLHLSNEMSPNTPTKITSPSPDNLAITIESSEITMNTNVLRIISELILKTGKMMCFIRWWLYA